MSIPDEIIREVVEHFSGVSGRLEFLREVRGIKIYNDTTATTPDATVAALKALGSGRNIILIIGGADKGLDMSRLIEEIPNYCKTVVLLPGTGTKKIQSLKLKVKSFEAKLLKEAVDVAMKEANGGDVILFSPAFASFGLFKNEFDRGEQFCNVVSEL